MLRVLIPMISFIIFSGSAFAQNVCSVQPVTISHDGATSPNNNPKQLVFIDTTKFPQAVCNDGTPAAFVFRPGTGASTGRWIIHFEGGGDCYDAASCLTRWQQAPALTTSSYLGTPANPNLKAISQMMSSSSGIMSPDATTNPDFWDANIVDVLYCSSDDHIGNHTGTGAFSPANINTWNFNGSNILGAVRQTLNEKYGFANAKEVLLTGSSAGGVGAYLRTNKFASKLPSTARFVAMGDAGFFDSSFPAFDSSSTVPPYFGSTNPTAIQAIETASLALWKGQGDAVCAQSAKTEQQKTLCRDTSYVLNNGFVQIPTFITQSDLDTYQLENIYGVLPCEIEGNCHPSIPGVQQKADTYVKYFQGNLLNDIVTTQNSSPTAGIVIQSPHHELTVNPIFTTLYPSEATNEDVTIAQVFGQWYRDPCNPNNRKIITTTPLSK